MNEKSTFYNSLHQYKLSRVATLNIILRTYTIVRASLVIKIANKFFISLSHSRCLSAYISVTTFYSSTNSWRSWSKLTIVYFFFHLIYVMLENLTKHSKKFIFNFKIKWTNTLYYKSDTFAIQIDTNWIFIAYYQVIVVRIMLSNFHKV